VGGGGGGGGEVAACDEDVGVVGSQDVGAVFEGLLEEGDGLIEPAGPPGGAGGAAGRGGGGGGGGGERFEAIAVPERP